LNSHGVEYLIIGGYAVGFYGNPRATGDMDVWIATHPGNASKVVAALRAFGFGDTRINAALFQTEKQVIRMGVPPLRIELLTSISGVDFAACYARRMTKVIDEVPVPFISLEDLRTNKRASGCTKDLSDLEELSWHYPPEIE
jgi:hypothetical protein